MPLHASASRLSRHVPKSRFSLKRNGRRGSEEGYRNKARQAYGFAANGPFSVYAEALWEGVGGGSCGGGEKDISLEKKALSEK